MRSLLFTLALFAGLSTAYGQNEYAFVTQDRTYYNLADNGNIKFYADGRVGINGAVKIDYTYKNDDGYVKLYYKKKQVNMLIYSTRVLHFRGGPPPAMRAKLTDCDCLLDKRDIIYTHIADDND